jgi:CO dehydrogenase/acetyl-CoA synthase alpha subunit
MKTITQIYESILDKRIKGMSSKEAEYEGSSEHESSMSEMAIEIAKIGQKVKMGTCKEYDGDRLISIARDIQKEYK